MERPAKLHGVLWCKWQRVLVDVEVATVRDGSGPAISLGNDTQRTEPAISMVDHQMRWQQRPVALPHHVDALLSEEISVLFGRFVRPSCQGSVSSSLVPRRCLHQDRHPFALAMAQEVCRWMGERLQFSPIPSGIPLFVEEFFPAVRAIEVARRLQHKLVQLIWRMMR